jgi:hypothetical protein
VTDPLALLATTQLFEGVAASDLESLRPAIRTRTFDRGSYLFREGDPGTYLQLVGGPGFDPGASRSRTAPRLCPPMTCRILWGPPELTWLGLRVRL